MTGFRVTILLQGFIGNSFRKNKCLVFIEERWTKVADLEDHLKNILCVKSVEVFIDDCWVSSEEPICIIKPSDIISVREVEHLPEQSANAAERISFGEDSLERKEKRSKKKKIVRSPDNTSDEPEVVVTAAVATKTADEPEVVVTAAVATKTADEPEVVVDAALATKKQELLMKVDAVLSPEEMDVTDDAAPPAKKKRRRKRPSKKRKEMLESLSVGAALSCMTQQTYDTPHTAPAPAPQEVYTRPTSSHHIIFDDESFQDNSENTAVGNEAPKEDWQERLLALTQERKKPVFVRTEMADGSDSSPYQNGVGGATGVNGCAKLNGDDADGKYDSLDVCHTSYIHNSVPTETAKANDVLYFKRLNVVFGQPQISDHLLALVEEVDDHGMVVLKIFEGKVEQNFTADEIQDLEDGYFIVKVDWRHVIEPRLIVDASMLSKYL